MTNRSWIRRPLPHREGNVALILICINIVLFFARGLTTPFSVTLASGQTVWLNVSNLLSMHPVLTVQEGFVFQPFSYMFMHADFRHLFFNMLGLFFFGTQVERTIGSNEFLLFYLTTGFLAGVFSLAMYWLTGALAIQLLGASGAVFAVLLAFATYYPDARIFIFGILPIRAAVLVGLYTVIELWSQISGSRTGVAHLTHLAGFGFAFLYLQVRMGINPARRLLGR